MGKIQITCDIKGDEPNANTIKLEVENSTENDLANVLREIFSTVIRNKLVRRNILMQVIVDVLEEMR